MTPSHARKGGIKYRYYLSSALIHGANRAGSVSRVPAVEIEALVINTLREHLGPKPPIDDRGLVKDFVTRVEIQQERLVIQLASDKKSREGTGDITLRVPWQKQTQLAAVKCSCPKAPICESSVRYAQKIAQH